LNLKINNKNSHYNDNQIFKFNENWKNFLKFEIKKVTVVIDEKKKANKK
jgi:hypothetical protein